MTDSPEQQSVFNGILQVLQRIEAKLETHELRVRHVEDLIRSHRSDSTQSQDISTSSSQASSATSGHQSLDTGPVFRTRNSNPRGNVTFDAEDHRENEGEAISTYSRAGPRFEYSLWRSDRGNEDPTDMLNESHRGLLRNYLGSCSVMPDDGRLPLSFSWSTSNVRRRSITLQNPLDHQIAAPGTLQLVDNLAEARRLEALRAFDTDLRHLPGNDFLVVDVDSSNHSRLYRIGQDAIGGELMVRSEPSHDAPWSRLMYERGSPSSCMDSLTVTQSLPRHEYRKQYQARIRCWFCISNPIFQARRYQYWTVESYLFAFATQTSFRLFEPLRHGSSWFSYYILRHPRNKRS